MAALLTVVLGRADPARARHAMGVSEVPCPLAHGRALCCRRLEAADAAMPPWRSAMGARRPGVDLHLPRRGGR
eukprot:5065741-Alexandrium_andersonii.AAC.1